MFSLYFPNVFPPYFPTLPNFSRTPPTFPTAGAAVFCAQRLGGRSGRHISRSRVARRLRVRGPECGDHQEIWGFEPWLIN